MKVVMLTRESASARLLGIDPRTVSRKLERWDEEAESPAPESPPESSGRGA